MNPYTPSSSTLFYGREQIMRDLFADEQQGQSVVLSGGRRCGKTWILRRMKDYLLGLAEVRENPGALWQEIVPDAVGPEPKIDHPAHWPFLIDLQGLSPERLSDVYDYIAASLTRDVPPQVQPPPSPPPRGMP